MSKKYSGGLVLVFCVQVWFAFTQDVQLWDSLVRQLQDRDQLFGCALLSQHGHILREFCHGYENFREEQPLHQLSSFNLASVSKQFFAVGIMLLKQDGLLTYDDPVSLHLVDFPYRNVTIRQLLTHTSGLPEYFEPASRHFPLNHTISSQDILNLFKSIKLPLEFRPGDRWAYCNTNYVFLALILEQVAGQSIEQFMAKRIFTPFKLNNTYVYHLNLASQPNHRVIGYRVMNQHNYQNDLTHFDGVYGDGNIYSTPRDLNNWLQALIKGEVLPLATLEEAWTPVRLNDGSSYPYGFGWFIDGAGFLSHTGSWVGFRNLIRVDRVNKTVLTICSNNTSAELRILDQVVTHQPAVLPPTQLITNVHIIDGSGRQGYLGAVRINGKIIDMVGSLQPWRGEEIIDGRGFTLSPGFIDSHSHHAHDYSIDDAVIPAVSQGITTIVTGQDGFSHFPLQDFYQGWEKQPGSINVASFVGHNTLRLHIMGNQDFQRTATASEIIKMGDLVRQEMQAGALGLSTGLEYDPGIWSNTAEVLSLAKIAGEHHGRYASHIRSEDMYLEEAVEELLTIGREAKLPVHLSHFKVGMKSKWGLAYELIQRLHVARQNGIQVTADIYPYTYWHSTLEVLFPKRDFDNLTSAEFALKELSSPEGMLIADYALNPAFVGKTIAQIAQEKKTDPAIVYMQLIKDARSAQASESVIGTAMSEEDIEYLLSWPFTNLCSDGSGQTRHPRGYGAFPRFLAHYIRDKQVLTTQEAVRRMTSLAAENCGIPLRGLIAPGYFADLVLWNPHTVQDHATTTDPHRLSSGIIKVWVNGQLVFNEGQITTARPGLIIKNAHLGH